MDTSLSDLLNKDVEKLILYAKNKSTIKELYIFLIILRHENIFINYLFIYELLIKYKLLKYLEVLSYIDIFKYLVIEKEKEICKLNKKVYKNLKQSKKIYSVNLQFNKNTCNKYVLILFNLKNIINSFHVIENYLIDKIIKSNLQYDEIYFAFHNLRIEKKKIMIKTFEKVNEIDNIRFSFIMNYYLNI